ncbi:unnamed protein product, partial [marine sediment metagenome]
GRNHRVSGKASRRSDRQDENNKEVDAGACIPSGYESVERVNGHMEVQILSGAQWRHQCGILK